ncbi:alpha/beta hydrolase fold domain-containing protein [Nocardioides ochotonae]|uniref:alpha/beta hydrolase fold domain-containing protein n=1 Tax=Nocardioides ochotonae TaxID=2685869 RepID=UPI001CD569D1|nr:alpha/beta hydrolase [Nocardioides ochotonae]
MSWQMRTVGALMRVTRRRRFADPDGGPALLARPKGPSDPPARLRRRCVVETDVVEGFAVHRVRARATAPGGPAVVYLHGGAYVSEIVRQHWSLVEDLATAPGPGVEVVVPIYGLAPQHHATDALRLTGAVLRGLLDEDRPVHLAGDSAGAGLALALALHHRPLGPGLLRGLTLMAPWLDLRMANPGIDAVEPHDPWLARPALHAVARSWAGGLPLTDPRVSPVLGSDEALAALPPVELWVGTRDITLPDTRLLAERLRAAGVAVRLHEEPGAIHVHPLLPVPEGRAARRELVRRAVDSLAVAPA